MEKYESNTSVNGHKHPKNSARRFKISASTAEISKRRVNFCTSNTCFSVKVSDRSALLPECLTSLLHFFRIFAPLSQRHWEIADLLFISQPHPVLFSS